MNIFKKIKDYDRVCKALEDERAVRNQIKVDLDVAKAEVETLKRGIVAANQDYRDLVTKCGKLKVYTLDAPEPEKRKYYTLVLQKQLMPFIVKKDGRIFISVVAPEG